MTKGSVLYSIERAWKRRILFKAVAWVLLITGASIFWMAMDVGSESVLPVLVVSLLFFLWRENNRVPKDQEVIKLVNEQFDQIEYSTELLVDNQSGGLLDLQRQKVEKAFKEKLPDFRYPVAWKDFGVVAGILSLALLIAGFAPLRKSPFTDAKSNIVTSSELDQASSDTVYLKSISAQIAAPKYSGLGTITENSPNINVLEGSTVTWNLDFAGTPKKVWIMYNGDSLSIKDNRIRLKPDRSAIYSIHFNDNEGNPQSSDYYQLALEPDTPPNVAISGIPQFHRLEFRPSIEIEFDVEIEDDFGLTDGYLIATITKGAGESVKFREQKIPFSRTVSGENFKTSVSLSTADFDMESGNELYFYATAIDNKQPERQQSKTETHFFILQDTAEVEFSLQGSLGVDLMPDFFRSQLQIIMDTEKLIKEKASLKKRAFNSESNTLGYDQKQLRLKYGQFIGEEEDSGLEVEQEEPEDIVEPNADNVLQEFGHDHDHENEAGQLMDKGTHQHEDELDPEAEEDPLEDFMHNHEDEETATFYTQTLKAKLRAALTQMWDAELYLRLFEPHKSLPYQYEAHRLLKEIRNHARIYVQRIGFDPPPINESESRLTGKLREVNDHPFYGSNEKPSMFPAIRAAVDRMGTFQVGRTLTDEDKTMLREGGNELASLAIENPGEYLIGLNRLSELLKQSTISEATFQSLLEIRMMMVSALPDETRSVSGQERSSDALNVDFADRLNSKTNQ